MSFMVHEHSTHNVLWRPFYNGWKCQLADKAQFDTNSLVNIGMLHILQDSEI